MREDLSLEREAGRKNERNTEERERERSFLLSVSLSSIHLSGGLGTSIGPKRHCPLNQTTKLPVLSLNSCMYVLRHRESNKINLILFDKGLYCLIRYLILFDKGTGRELIRSRFEDNRGRF